MGNYDIVRHRDAQTAHLINRFRERFGLRVNYDTLRSLHNQIKTGNAKLIRDQILSKVYEIDFPTGETRRNWRKDTGNKVTVKIWLAFDMLTDQISTVMIPGELRSVKLEHASMRGENA